jgi:exosortase/archaeosortase family protein
MKDTLQTIRRKVTNVVRMIRRNITVNLLIKFLPFFSFIVPIITLYFLYPKSFEGDPAWEGYWQGRFLYLFFLWLAFLELILNWEKLTNKINRLKSIRTIGFTVALLLPMIYVIAGNFWGMNTIIANIAMSNNIPHANLMPLASEYFVFSIFFTFTILLMYGINHLGDFSISGLFLGLIGILYTIDNLYPTGQFTPFQILVPTTASLAANLLRFMGYQTRWIGVSGGMPTFQIWDSLGRPSAAFSIAWPCAGIESLLLYTVTILLFLKKFVVSWWQKTAYFIVGAIITYFINILRIATIFIVSIPYWSTTSAWLQFHNIYGPLYSITWITSYPLIIIGIQAAWRVIRKPRKLKGNLSNAEIG